MAVRRERSVRLPPASEIAAAGDICRRSRDAERMTVIPAAIISAPATRATATPAGPSFSMRTKAESAVTQARFMTPTAKRIAMIAQQQPRQYWPWRRPVWNAPVAPSRQHDCVVEPFPPIDGRRRR